MPDLSDAETESAAKPNFPLGRFMAIMLLITALVIALTLGLALSGTPHG